MTGRALLMRLLTAVTVLSLAVLLAAGVALCLGSEGVPPDAVLRALSEPASSDPTVVIVREIRLPRVLLAGIVGACLALAGTALQGLLRNPLADPYIVGTSAGAALGAAVAIVTGLGASAGGAFAGKPLLAFVGAVATMYCVYRLAQVDGRLPVDTFLLAGVVVGSFLWALVSFLLSVSQGKLQEIVFWLMGDLSAADWGQVQVALPYLVLGVAAMCTLAHPLNLMAVGEESAAHLGVAVERTKLMVVAWASLVTAAAVSVSGLIGFMGLMVPHALRSVWGADHRVLLPASVLGGAAFLICADTAARLSHVPVGVITALLGGPFFFLVLHRQRGG